MNSTKPYVSAPELEVLHNALHYAVEIAKASIGLVGYLPTSDTIISDAQKFHKFLTKQT